ncbi:phosphonate ABC transporter ATP-binding protein [Azospirillum soli]|uniref:phosphonate ABC transporter ATP-binding protein n=1 Tax=Azospirillum soli TaxID=1304799 RepID=UPI001AE3346E|nr:phosphonate ABC transporter ATP-binding protein [Azospirillum soli]MBP2315395.1 phosphonate transport system ATP-binding protein [Azospirillum soli]
MPTDKPAIRVSKLSKTFKGCKALETVSLDIAPGEMVALIGASGSGKSTLLRHLAGLALGDDGTGSVDVLGTRVQSRGQLASDIRRTRSRVGFVFQQFNLVGRLPVMTNVLTGSLGRVPLWRSLTGRFTTEERRLALDALDRVGIADKSWTRASALSGGQQQRAAIARTLVQKAEVILADEPIASLDPVSSRRVMETLARINTEDGVTVVVSLHQVDFAIRYCPRTIALKKGAVIYDGPSAALTPSLLRELYGSQAEELGTGVQGSASFVTGLPSGLALAANA